MKKAQVTVFIIIGLIIVVSTALLFFLPRVLDIGAELEGAEGIAVNRNLVEGLVSDCLNDLGPPGLYLLARKGGFIYDFENSLITDSEEVAYHLDLGVDVSPSRDFMESEFSRYVSDTLKLCILDADIFQGITLDFGESTVNTEFAESTVFVEINYPITLTQQDKRVQVSEFNKVYNINFKRLLDTADELKIIVSDPDTLNFGELDSLDLEVDILPLEGENIVYSVVDTNTRINDVPLTFNFATKIMANNAPKISYVPDFVLAPSQTISFDINATDVEEDVLTFFSNNSNVRINEITGLMLFTASERGEFPANVCVKDSFENTDCTEVTFIVQ